MIKAVHQRLDTFELRVLTHPAPSIYMVSFQPNVACLRADIDAFLDMRVPET